MKDFGIVKGSKVQAVPLLVGVDTVYVHTDIKALPPDENGNDMGYQYHEIQYEKDEYIQLLAEKNSNMEQQLNDTKQESEHMLLALNMLLEGMEDKHDHDQG